MLIWAPLLFAFCFGPVGVCEPHAAPIPAVARAAAAPQFADTTAAIADAWFAEDKLRHFFMSFAATSFAYGAARTAGLGHGPAELAAGASAAAAGVWKEFHDRRRGGPFSYRDLAWDAVGIAAALILAVQTR